MRSVLISIKPEWVAKILNGEKTIEIRKTMPKCELPIDVYIYCTKGDYIGRISKKYVGKIVARFTLDKVEEIELPYTKFGCEEWVGCEEERTLQTKAMSQEELLKKGCLSEDEIYGYLNFKNKHYGYAWHISDLEIFREPKKLSEFGAKRAPQSWCYVEEKKDKKRVSFD